MRPDSSTPSTPPGPVPVRDTIAAIATPPGLGGVAVVRLSGPDSRAVAASLFRSSRPGFAGFRPYVMHHGYFHESGHEPDAGQAPGRAIDEVLVVSMPGPGSFTGEDVVEVHCHGGRTVPRAVLSGLLAAGARLALPGEFSRRAFLNGRMDLTRAEAVAEVICAPTRTALDLAAGKLQGHLARRIGELRAALEGLRVRLCLAVDFPEDEVECLDPAAFAAGVSGVLAGLDGLVRAYERGRPFREGATAVLAGRVNAGKSSLLNALLGRERAIVADLPGTTRDFLEETVVLDGLPVRLVDTAGLRHLPDLADTADGTPDQVELQGARASLDLAGRADLVLLVVDGSRPLSPEDLAFARERRGRGGPGARVLAVVSKSDLDPDPAGPDPAGLLAAEGLPVARVSARTGAGLAELAAAIRDALLSGTGGPPEPEAGEIVPNLRQCEAVRRASAELRDLLADLGASVPCDLLSVRLETACAVLAEITGEIAPAAVLDAVFSAFCIGK